MKNIVFLTSGIYSLSNGRSIASYGYCQEFAKYAMIQVFSSLPHDITAEDVMEDGFGIHFCRENRRTLGKTIRYAWDYLVFKTVGIIEVTKPHTMAAVKTYMQNNPVDMVVIDHLALIRYFLPLKKAFSKVVFVYNSHNAEGINYYQQLTGKDYDGGRLKRSDFTSLLDYWKCAYLFRMEKRMLTLTDYSIAISKNDRELLRRQYGIQEGKILHTKPLAKFTRVKKPQDMEQFHYKLLIVGSMGWYPNVRGILWFVEKVFEPLIQKEPMYKLYIVGRGPVQELKDVAAKYPNNVVLTGEVPSTEPYFAQCDISIVPVFEGTGIKIKVLESMARGIPTICSGFAAKDYDFQDEVIVADSPREFLEGIRTLTQCGEVRLSMYQKMEQYCTTYYDLTKDMKQLLGV